MKGKRILAALLCVAMIATSGSFTKPVFAQDAQGASVEMTDEGQEILVEGEGLADDGQTVYEESAAGQTDDDADAQKGEEDAAEAEPDVPEEKPVVEEGEEAQVIEDGDADTEDADVTEEEALEETSEEEERLGVMPETPDPHFTGGGPLDWAGEVPETLPETILLPEGVTSIPDGIFDTEPGSYVRNIYFSDDALQTIEEGAFESSAIEAILFPNGMPTYTIGDRAFMNTPINSIDLNLVTTIGENAFANCSSLPSVNLTSAETIGKYAFKNCSQLTTVTWGTKTVSIGEEAFRNCKLKIVSLEDMVSYDESDPPEMNVLIIGKYAFADNASLEEVTLPVSLATIPQGAFSGCTKLTSVIMDDMDTYNQTTSIGKEAFKNCSKLAGIEIGLRVTEIASLAFDGCIALNAIRIYEPAGDVEIAENAFPIRTDGKATIYGFDGKVKAYVNENLRGYKYQYLGKKYKINRATSVYGSVAQSLDEACAGEKITLTATPREGFTFYRLRVKYKDGNSDKFYDVPEYGDGKLVLTASNTSAQVYTFIMPASEVWIIAYGMKSSDLVNGTLTWTFSPAIAAQGDREVVFPYAGAATTIKVKCNGESVGPWNFKMKSTDPAIAAINQFGEIIALKNGEANISLVALGNESKNIQISVKVGESKSVDVLDFAPFFDPVPDDPTQQPYIEDAVIRVPIALQADPDNPDDPFADPEYFVVEYDVSAVEKVDHTFSPRVFSYYLEDPEDPDSEVEIKYVNSTWSTTDRKLVTVKNAASNSNDNLITVLKGGFGEAFITASVKNDDGTTVETGFIVKIVDSSPRLLKNRLEINTFNREGVVVPVTHVYDYAYYQDYDLRTCTKVVKNGITTYDYTNVMATGFRAKFDTRGNIVLSADPTTLKLDGGKSATYQNLYIEGKQYRDDRTPGRKQTLKFRMRIPEIYVINKTPTIKLSYSGKINLLYNSNYEKNDTNMVSVYHNVTDLKMYELDSVELVSEANNKLPNSELPDKFASNFTVGQVLVDATGNEIGFKIGVNPAIETDDQFMKTDDKNKKIVNSGYAKIKFRGFNYPITVPITIPCDYTFPKYVLSMTKVNTHTRYFPNPEYKVQILDAGNKKAGVDLYSTTYDDAGEVTDRSWKVVSAYNEYPASSMQFNAPDEGDWEYALDAKGDRLKDEDGKYIFKDYLKLSANGTVNKTIKEHLVIRMEEWRKPMGFDFTMVPYTGAVTTKLAPAAISLNKSFPDQQTEVKINYNLQGVKLNDMSELVYVPGSKREDIIAAGEELAASARLSVDTDNNVMLFGLENADLDTLVKGRYTFTMIPSVYFSGVPIDLPAVRFSITITESAPVMSLKKSTFTLNTNYAGMGEIAPSDTAVSGLPKGAVYEICNDIDDMETGEIDYTGVNVVAVPRNGYAGKWAGDIYEIEAGIDPETKRKYVPEWDPDSLTWSHVDWTWESQEYTYDDEDPKKIPTGTGWKNAFSIHALPDADGRLTKLGISIRPMAYVDAFNYDYYVYGIRYMAEGGSEEITNPWAKPLKIRISGQYLRKPVVKLTPVGGLNQIIPDKVHPDPDCKTDVAGYELVFKVSMTNLYGTLSEENLKLAEVDSRTNTYYENDQGYYSPHFFAELREDEKTKEQSVVVTLNPLNIYGSDDVPQTIEKLRNDAFHHLILYYDIQEIEGPDKSDYQDLRIVPKQILPVIQTLNTKGTIYEGWRLEDRVVTFDVGLTTAQSAILCPAAGTTDTMNRKDVVKIPDGAHELFRKSIIVKDVQQFEPLYDEQGDPVLDDQTGDPVMVPLFLKDVNGNYILDKNKNKIPAARITLQLVRPSLLVGETNYNVVVELRYEGQAEDTPGNVVKYEMMLKK
ncbi:MAG: leucine-rich repeat domain-containing protein [Lachnospiraceae bacterium]|nr:leucine-rich repeat domain-containing protein [Lachnospiraceae bacterium]